MYTLVDDSLIQLLADNDSAKAEWLFLEPHPDFPGQWYVNCFDGSYYFDFEEVIGPYRVIAPSGLQIFLDHAKALGYKVAFFEDPTAILKAYEGLNEPPEVTLNSDLEGTINGFLPFQVQGFNYLKDLNAGVAMWSTGTGKTVLASGLIKYHSIKESFDTALFVVKTHNKINTQRALDRLANLDSVVIDGSKHRRRKQWSEIDQGGIVITNYEKFRADQEELLWLCNNRRLLFVWDEMPTKLKTRTTKLYTGVCNCLYDTRAPQVKVEKRRPSELRQYMLSATPIENDPEDWFNCVRLMDPTVYGTVKEFRDEYVRRYSFFDANKPEAWHKLDKMGLKAAHITHQVDKADPDIAKQFPDVIDEFVYIDWDNTNRKVYEKLIARANDDEINPVALISVLQMLCDAPTMLSNSAQTYEDFERAFAEWNGEDAEPDKEGSLAAWQLVQDLDFKLSNDGHPKIERLQELITEDHPNEKIAVFSAFNDALLPILEDYCSEWGVSYVRYSGSPGQRQSAQDAFTSDPSVRVFLSSDVGSDSINLEVGSVVVHYDLPWKWSTKIQRQNRIHRVTSEFETVRYYTLMMADSVEERKRKIVEKKYQYHQGVFKGAISDRSASARMTREDLLWILRG